MLKRCLGRFGRLDHGGRLGRGGLLLAQGHALRGLLTAQGSATHGLAGLLGRPERVRLDPLAFASALAHAVEELRGLVEAMLRGLDVLLALGHRGQDGLGVLHGQLRIQRELVLRGNARALGGLGVSQELRGVGDGLAGLLHLDTEGIEVERDRLAVAGILGGLDQALGLDELALDLGDVVDLGHEGLDRAVVGVGGVGLGFEIALASLGGLELLLDLGLVGLGDAQSAHESGQVGILLGGSLAGLELGEGGLGGLEARLGLGHDLLGSLDAGVLAGGHLDGSSIGGLELLLALIASVELAVGGQVGLAQAQDFLALIAQGPDHVGRLGALARDGDPELGDVDHGGLLGGTTGHDDS
jgi:hypothetical protein